MNQKPALPAFAILDQIDYAGGPEGCDLTTEVHAAVAEAKAALRDMVALFHAVNSGHVAARNPYAFPALQRANAALTGDRYECGFSLIGTSDALIESGGRRTGL